MKAGLFGKIISMILVIATLFTTLPLTVFAEELEDGKTSSTPEVYIKSIKLVQAKTKEEAKRELESKGYIFLNNNLNEGTGEDGIWLGYLETTDPAEAIYDLKVMNMKGGFTLTSVEEAIKKQETAFAQMAEDLTYLIDEFVKAYRENNVAALKAYQALNFFRMTAGETELIEENGLGYQMVNGFLSISELTEIIMFCDSDIVDSIIKILTTGIQLGTENWMEELSKKGPYDSDASYGMNEAEIKRRAEQILIVLQFYAQAYNAMDASGLIPEEFDDNGDPVYNEGDRGENLPAEEAEIKKIDESRYKLYKIVFDELAKYKYGDGGSTLKDFFLSMAKESNAKKLYPLVSVLSDGEFAALSYGCFIEMATGVTAKIEDFDSYDEVYEDLTKDVKSLYIYQGVDKALLEEAAVIGFTDAASRHMATTGELEFYEKESDGENSWETGKMVAKGIAALGSAVIGVAKITFGVTMLISTISTTVATSVESGMLAGVMKFCTLISGGYATLIVAAAVLITVAISYFVMLDQEDDDTDIDWENNPIPKYLYDVKEISLRQTSTNDGVASESFKKPVFIFYEAVTDTDDNTIDLNAFSDDASQWISLYVTYDRQGDDAKPIKSEDLLVKTGNGEVPEGYEPLTSFNQVIAYDLNRWDEQDDVNGIYLFYKQDKNVAVESDVTHYIYDVYLQVGESDAHCIDLLLAAGYTPLNVNLTPNVTDDDIVASDSIYTYLGYKTTTNENSAIRDLRLEYGPSRGEVKLGSSTYAECGSNGYVTLYATKYKTAGTPILAGGIKHLTSRNHAPEGYEPVNFFSGGPATNINVGSKGIYYDGESYLYFLPNTTFTSGTEYLSGISYVSYLFDALEEPMMDSEHDEYVVKYLKEYTGWKYEGEYMEMYIAGGERWVPAYDYEANVDALYRFVNHKAGYDYVYGISNTFVPYYDRDEDCVWDVVMYSKTYNPYRAIYDIKGTSIDNSQPNLNLESVGYTSWTIARWDEHHFINPDTFRLSSCYLTFNTNPGASEVDLGSRLYVTGNLSSSNEYDSTEMKMKETQPISVADFQVMLSGSNSANKETLTPVTDIFTDSKNAVEFCNEETGKKFSFYFDRSATDRPYISAVTAVDKLSLIRNFGGYEKDIEYHQITDSMMLAQLANQGATNFSGASIEFFNKSDVIKGAGINALRFGYTRSAESSQALRDMFFYFNGFSNDDPPKELYRGNVKYKLITEIPYELTAYADAPKMGVYLYGTTDSRAGNRIIDFQVTESPFLWGYETVRTMNGGSLATEMRNYAEKYANNHLLGHFEDLFERIQEFFGEDAYYNSERENELFYLHVKREGDSLKQQKPYIGEIYIAYGATQDSALEQLFDMGAEYYVNMNLNSNTPIQKAQIFIGYSYTADPDDAIKGLVAYHHKNPPATLTDSSGCDYYLVSDVDLNKYALGDYIYLYATKETVHNSDPVVSLNADIRAGVGIGYMDWIDGTKMPVRANCTKMWGSDSYSDLNDGAGGDYVYLMYNTMKTNLTGSYTDKIYGGDVLSTRDPIADVTATGKYIGALYVMDKNTIRQEKLAQGISSDACTCDKITDQEVFDRLRAMGATTIIETPIQISGDFYGNNNNKVFIGYSRTNNSKKAIRSIAIKTEVTSLKEPPESLTIDKKVHKLVAEAAKDVKELPRAINLIGLQDCQDMLIPRMYLYYSTLGSGDPICDICIDSDPIKNDWNTVRSDGGLDPFADIYAHAEKQYELANAEYRHFNGSYTNSHELMIYTAQLKNAYYEIMSAFHTKKAEAQPFYIHVKRCDTATLAEEKPYIGEVFIASGSSRHAALSALAAFEPDGFIDADINRDAGGTFVYMGYKRVAKEKDALTDLVIFQGKNPAATRKININGSSVKYDLVDNLDLNEDAGGKYLYLYATDSTKTGNYITSLTVDQNITSYLKCGVELVTVRLANGTSITDEYIDLNKGAGGEYLYLIMQRETTAGHNGVDTGKFKEKLPTCGADGYYTKYLLCKDCNLTYEETTVSPATGKHSDAEGDKNHKCDECGKKNLTTHVRGEAKIENRVEATEDTDGSYNVVYYCVECNSKLSSSKVIIPAGTPAPTTVLGASVFGTGSVIAICSIAAIALAAAVIIYFMKKKQGDIQNEKND